MQKIKENLSHILEQAITVVEFAIALLLVILVTLGFGYLSVLLFSLFKTHVFLTPGNSFTARRGFDFVPCH